MVLLLLQYVALVCRYVYVEHVSAVLEPRAVVEG